MMNKSLYLILLVIPLFHCSNNAEKSKKCECVSQGGVQVSMPDMTKEELQNLCSSLGGQLQNCP